MREDSSELRREIANADVLMTTWHSPFITADMLGKNERVKLIAHCGGEVKARVAEEVFEFVAITNAADPMARGVAEMALAHTLPSKVEAAYRRGDLFAKRAHLMDDWAKFCAVPVDASHTVVPIKKQSNA